MAWHVYELAPIDLGWHHLPSVEETAARLGADEARSQVSRGELGGEDPSSADFIARWEAAKDAARDKGWEGDFRHDPVVFWVPAQDFNFLYGFVFKQDNNGTTYVVSPVPLPHLVDG